MTDHVVPRYVPGEQYERAYDLASRRGRQTVELRAELDRLKEVATAIERSFIEVRTLEAENERLRAVLTQVVHETGTSTMAHKIALAALHADKEGE